MRELLEACSSREVMAGETAPAIWMIDKLLEFLNQRKLNKKQFESLADILPQSEGKYFIILDQQHMGPIIKMDTPPVWCNFFLNIQDFL